MNLVLWFPRHVVRMSGKLAIKRWMSKDWWWWYFKTWASKQIKCVGVLFVGTWSYNSLQDTHLWVSRELAVIRRWMSKEQSSVVPIFYQDMSLQKIKCGWSYIRLNLVLWFQRHVVPLSAKLAIITRRWTYEQSSITGANLSSRHEPPKDQMCWRSSLFAWFPSPFQEHTYSWV